MLWKMQISSELMNHSQRMSQNQFQKGDVAILKELPEKTTGHFPIWEEVEGLDYSGK